MVYYLSMIVPDETSNLMTNQPISIAADTTSILFNIETVNYKYSVKVTKEMAEMNVVYKGKMYKFTYRNHTRSFPFISSYMNILLDTYTTIELFRDFLRDYVLKRRLHCNLVINGSITLPPAPPSCQL